LQLLISVAFGVGWLGGERGAARRSGEGYGADMAGSVDATTNELIRERASVAQSFDPAEIGHGRHSEAAPSIIQAALPLGMVVVVNLVMSLIVLPRMDLSFLSEERWGSTSLSAVAGVWSVVVALAAATAAVILLNRSRFRAPRETIDAGAHASVLPVVSVASLVGFGAVIAALPAFAV